MSDASIPLRRGRFGSLLRPWTAEPRRLLVFIGVGLAATLVYGCLASLFVRVAGMPAVPASLLSYALGACVSWSGHGRFTFAGRTTAAGGRRTYALLTALGFAISTAVPAIMVDGFGLPIEAAVLATALIVPGINFMVMDRAIFRVSETQAVSPAPAGSPLSTAAGVAPVYALVAGGAVAIVLAVRWTSFTYDGDLNRPIAALVVLLACGLLLRWRGVRRIGGLFEGAALFLAISAVASLGSFLLAATALPYADATLVAADRVLLGFDWRRFIDVFIGEDQTLYVLSWVYSTLTWQPMVLLALLFFIDEGRAWRFLAAWTFALAATVAIFPLAPALGGYLHHAISHGDFPGVAVPAAWRHVEVLGAVRDGSLRLVDAKSLVGIITFPSFHAAAAVVLAWGCARLPFVGWAGVLLNAAMFASSVVIGGHYLVDVLAGGLIALVALWTADRLAGRRGSASEMPATS